MPTGQVIFLGQDHVVFIHRTERESFWLTSVRTNGQPDQLSEKPTTQDLSGILHASRTCFSAADYCGKFMRRSRA